MVCLLPGCSADDEVATFSKVFGGAEHDIGRGIAIAADDEYIITGSTYAEAFGFIPSDIWLLKINESGSERWSRTIRGPDWDHGYDVLQARSGNSVLVGYTWSYGAGETDIILKASTSSGDHQFQKYFGGDSLDRGYAVIELTDGGYMIAGETKSYGSGGFDAWVLVTDKRGNLLWDLPYGGAADDAAYDLVEATDSSYLLVGLVNDAGDGGELGADMFAEDGTNIWSRSYSAGSADLAWAVAKGTDGNFLLAGQTMSGGSGDLDIFLVSIDIAGTERWRLITGNTGDDAAHGAVAIADGAYVVTGYSSNANGNKDLIIMQIDANGVSVWSQTYDSGKDDRGLDLAQTSDGYVVTGVTNQTGDELDGDLWVIRTDNHGKSN